MLVICNIINNVSLLYCRQESYDCRLRNVEYSAFSISNSSELNDDRPILDKTLVTVFKQNTIYTGFCTWRWWEKRLNKYVTEVNSPADIVKVMQRSAVAADEIGRGENKCIAAISHQ